MSEPATPYLSLVIPAFNEAGRLPASLEKLSGFCESFTFPFEVWVIVEKSEDGTFELASRIVSKQANFHVIDNRVHRGKGYAVRSGMLKARGEFVFYMDTDLSVPLEEIPVFLDFFEKNPGVDLLAGNRQHPQSDIIKRQNWLRQKMGQTFNLILRQLAPVTIRDTQCGFKAFRARAAQEIFLRQQLDGFAFDVEVLLLAEKLGFKTVDLPVRWINSTESKVHIVRDSLRMFMDVIRIRRKL
ncbi:MAG: dolichyl-phosphate beta-glucosyltransferase [Verrucomicrobiota bacterium]